MPDPGQSEGIARGAAAEAQLLAKAPPSPPAPPVPLPRPGAAPGGAAATAPIAQRPAGPQSSPAGDSTARKRRIEAWLKRQVNFIASRL